MTLDNGLNVNVPGNGQLGGPLVKSTNIDTTTAFVLQMGDISTSLAILAIDPTSPSILLSVQDALGDSGSSLTLSALEFELAFFDTSGGKKITTSGLVGVGLEIDDSADAVGLVYAPLGYNTNGQKHSTWAVSLDSVFFVPAVVSRTNQINETANVQLCNTFNPAVETVFFVTAQLTYKTGTGTVVVTLTYQNTNGTTTTVNLITAAASGEYDASKTIRVRAGGSIGIAAIVTGTVTYSAASSPLQMFPVNN